MSMKWWMGNLFHKNIVILLAFVIVLSGCSLLPNEKEEEILPEIVPPQISQKPEYTVATKTLESKVPVLGKLISLEEETLYFSIGDRNVKDVYVKNGDKVKAGDIIAELDVDEMEKNLRLERISFQRDELAMKELLRQRDEMDQGEFEAQRIAFEEKRQKLADMAADINKATIVAPFSGTIVSLTVQKGDMAKAYSSVAIVANTSLMIPASKLTKTEQEKVTIGMEAQVTISNVGTFKGKISQMPSKTTDSNSGGGGNPGGGNETSVERIEDFMLIEVKDLPAGLTRGTPVSIQIVTKRTENAIVIPPSALRSVGNRTYVQVVDEKGNKSEVDVEVGQQTSTDVEILQGLKPGQKVVGR